MRLERLKLNSYGLFLEQELIFDPRPGRINLLVAPNGAGKSVLRRAFGDLLFGIPERSPMSWLYGTQNMRISAGLCDESGEFTLVRRKGRGDTLSDGSAPVPPEVVRRLLGSANQLLFEDLFALDSHLLRRGEEDLYRSNGRLGAMLLAGSGGLGRVRRLLDELEEARDAIGRVERRHEAQPLWRARKEAIEAGRALQQAALRPEAFLALERRAEEAAAALEALHGERDAVEARLGQLKALRAVRPWLARRDAALATLAGAGEVPRLEVDFEKRWRRALEAQAKATAAAETATQQAEAAAAALGEGGADTTLLAAAGAIEAELQEVANVRNAARDLPGIGEKARQAAAEAARLRSELGWDASVPVPPAPMVRAARDWIVGLAGLRAAVETAEHETIMAHNHLRAAQAELEALPEADDPAGLAALAREVRGAGLVARLETARRDRLDAAAALARALARLPDGVASREALAATQAPPAALLAARETALAAAETGHRDTLRERDRLAGELAARRAALAALRRDAALPEAGVLASARAARDTLWDAIAAGGTDFLPFERALRSADAIADALLAHSAEAARAATLQREIGELAERVAASEAACDRSAADLSTARAEMAALAAAAGAPAEALPSALREVLALREAALDRAIALDRTQQEETASEAALALARERLTSALGADGELPALLELADVRIKAALDAVALRKMALERHRETGRTTAEREAAGQRAGAALAEWLTGWRTRAVGLARAPDEPPETTGAALALIDELRRHEVDAAGFAARVREMQLAVDGFGVRMAALCATAAPALAGLAPQEAAVRLGEMLKAQQAEAARLKALGERHDAARADAQARTLAAGEASAALAALRRALRAGDNEAAETQLRRIARVAEAEKTLAEARGHILDQGGGRSEAALEELAGTSTAEGDAAEIAALEARQEALAARLEAASAEARSAAEARDRAGEGEDAQAASVRREAALADLARHAGDALLLHAAASLLRTAMEAEREESGSAAVARIGAVFRDLTGGAHAGVAVEEIGSDQVMVALEADGRGRKDIKEGLSEGSRDQLFLALRIAALEAYVRANPPLPFVADDILQTFDDNRATAALRALLALSEHVQVIVLTHHPHVRTLAATLPPGTVHTIVLSDLAAAA